MNTNQWGHGGKERSGGGEGGRQPRHVGADDRGGGSGASSCAALTNLSHTNTNTRLSSSPSPSHLYCTLYTAIQPFVFHLFAFTSSCPFLLSSLLSGSLPASAEHSRSINDDRMYSCICLTQQTSLIHYHKINSCEIRSKREHSPAHPLCVPRLSSPRVIISHLFIPRLIHPHVHEQTPVACAQGDKCCRNDALRSLIFPAQEATKRDPPAAAKVVTPASVHAGGRANDLA